MVSNSISFKSKEMTTARDLYDAQLSKIKQTAQKQNEIVAKDNSANNQIKQQIPMQGTGEKLDLMA